MKLKYDNPLYCSICNKLVGSRQLFNIELSPGTHFDTICTCAKCQKQKYYVPDFLDVLLNRKK